MNQESTGESLSVNGMYTVRDLRRILNITEESVRQARKDGLVAFRFGSRKLIFMGRDLQEWIMKRPAAMSDPVE